MQAPVYQINDRGANICVFLTSILGYVIIDSEIDVIRILRPEYDDISSG